MAGDWIKFELATLDKPEVLQMAEILGTSSDDVVGKLLRVWGWFDQQSRNGYAGGVTGTALKRFIDRLVASQGFAACMSKVGWLNDDGLPNFDRHNGETAKNRALSKNRMKRLRDAESVTTPSPEKRREEKSNNNICAGFERFWAAYPKTARKVGKAACLKSWERQRLDPLTDQIVSAVETLKVSDQWQKGFEPAPLTFLNQRRFEDGITRDPQPWDGAK